MAFKRETDFARNLTMGAYGTRAVARDLRDNHGHRIIELERCAMTNKIWPTKIKRLRLADLLCVSCGLRIEARGKSNLQVRLSHSSLEGRAWDDGLRPQDLCAFLVVHLDELTRQLSDISQPAYFTVDALRQVPHRTGDRKSARDGAELDVTWHCAVARKPAAVLSATGGRVSIRYHGSKRATPLGRDGYLPYVAAGDTIPAHTPVAGPLSRPRSVRCRPGTWSHRHAITSSDLIERFSATKAAGLLDDTACIADIARLTAREDTDVRLRLEALGALARLDHASAIHDLHTVARQHPEHQYRMEAVLILTELTETPTATGAMQELLGDSALGEELRAAAAWGLGRAGHNSFSSLWPHVLDRCEPVRLHVQAALGQPGEEHIAVLIDALATPDLAPIAAKILAESRRIPELLTCLADRQRRTWATQALGQTPPEEFPDDQLGAINPSTRRLLQALWTANFEDWSRQPDDQARRNDLIRQALTFDPGRYM